MLKNAVFTAFLLLISLPAFALSVDGNVFYLAEELKSSVTRSNDRTIYDFALTIDLNKKGTFFTGWNYSSYSQEDQETGNKKIKFSATEMGPLIGFTTKDHDWTLVAIYNIDVDAEYDDGTGTKEDWRGTTYKVSAGYRSPISDQFRAGLFFNYYSASFDESVKNQTTLTKVSYSKSSIYPSLSFSYYFE